MAKQDQDRRGDAMMLGLYVAVGAGLGFAVGTWLGRVFGWGTWGPIGGVCVGLAGGMYLMVKEAVRLNK